MNEKDLTKQAINSVYGVSNKNTDFFEPIKTNLGLVTVELLYFIKDIERIELTLVSVNKLNTDFACSIKLGSVNIIDKTVMFDLILEDKTSTKLDTRSIYILPDSSVINPDNKTLELRVTDIAYIETYKVE